MPPNKQKQEKMEQAERIILMEQHLNKAVNAVMNLSASLDLYEEAQNAVQALSNYYGSSEWKQDFADDEAGRLPKGIMKGVLSEDAIWNLLEDWREVKERIRGIANDH